MPILPQSLMQFEDAAGLPRAFAQARFSLTGTTTQTSVYSDPALTTPISQPVTADSAGFFPEIYYDASINTRMRVIWAGGDFASPAIDIDPVNSQVISAAGLDFIQEGSGAVTRSVQDKLREVQVSVRDFGDDVGGGDDDTDAFANAIAVGRPVFVPAGTYRINLTSLPSGLTLHGEDELSIIEPFDVDADAAIYARSADSTSFITGVTLKNLKFRGTVELDGFSEFDMLVSLHGMKRLRIIDCYFEGWRGDAILLGSYTGGQERHNIDVIVRGCHFDGVNNDNRNGFSVIDVDGLEVTGCSFRNCAKSDMPGSIDMEPDDSFSVIKNVRIHHNKFYNTDGNRGHVCLQTENSVHVENIYIGDNHMEDINSDSSAAVAISTSTSAPEGPLRIMVVNNTAEVHVGNFLYKRNGDVNGLIVSGNIASCLRGVWLSTSGAACDDSNEIIKGNTFFVENDGFGVLASENVQDLIITDNVITGTPTAHIQIGGNGTSSGVIIEDNDFIGTPTSGLTIKHTSTTPNGATNVLNGNKFPLGATHSFIASRTDFCGNVVNPVGVDTATIPNDYAPGIHRIRVSQVSIDGANQDGILTTYRLSSANITSVWQEFVPDYSATYTDDIYFRKAIDVNTWTAWWQLTGV